LCSAKMKASAPHCAASARSLVSMAASFIAELHKSSTSSLHSPVGETSKWGVKQRAWAPCDSWKWKCSGPAGVVIVTIHCSCCPYPPLPQLRPHCSSTTRRQFSMSKSSTIDLCNAVMPSSAILLRAVLATVQHQKARRH
jgi:hypothetical protein